MQCFRIFHPFVEAKCNETALTEAIDQIGIVLTDLETTIGNITTAKTNLREVVDCHTNYPYRNELFDYYEALCERAVVMGNVRQDLAIKKTILEKEKERCIQRSKFTLLKGKIFLKIFLDFLL